MSVLSFALDTDCEDDSIVPCSGKQCALVQGKERAVDPERRDFPLNAGCAGP